MGESEIISILSNSEIFNLTSILKTLIRGIGWGIINLLAFISNGIETVVNEIYSLNGFFSSQQLNDFIDEILPLAWVILALSIVFLGYKLIFDREFRVNNVFKNIALSIAVFMLLPMFMSHMEKMTTTGALGLKSEYNLSANKVIKDNLYDLYYLDENNFNLSKKNNIQEDLISLINIDEIVDASLVKNKDVFKNKISLDPNGQKKKEALGNGFLGLGKEEYYRYNFDFFVILTTLSCTTITLLATLFKVSRIIFELGFVKLFALLYSFADIANGQKLKEVIRYIVSNFVVLFLISVLLKMYLMFSSWASENSKGITQTILLIGASIAVIDGPNLIERIFGIDSGVKSGWSIVSAGYMGMKGAISTAKGLDSIANSIKNSAIGGGSMASGFMKGFREANKGGKLEDAMNLKNNSSNIEDNKDISSKDSSLHYQMDSKDGFQISIDDSVNTSSDNNMQSVNESNNLSNKESSNINNESIENTSGLQITDSKSLTDDLISLDEGISNLNELGQSNTLSDKPLEESMNDFNKSNLEPKPLSGNINSLDKEMNNLDKIEGIANKPNKSLEESMNDISKSNLESKPLSGNINSLDKEMSNLDKIRETSSVQNKSNLEHISLSRSVKSSNSNNITPLNKDIKVENNSNQPRTLSEHIKQTILDKPLIKSNYESGRSLGRITSNSIDKIKSKNKTIFDNKKR